MAQTQEDVLQLTAPPDVTATTEGPGDDTPAATSIHANANADADDDPDKTDDDPLKFEDAEEPESSADGGKKREREDEEKEGDIGEPESARTKLDDQAPSDQLPGPSEAHLMFGQGQNNGMPPIPPGINPEMFQQQQIQFQQGMTNPMFRELPFAQFGMVGMHDNSAMSQHLMLQQQFMPQGIPQFPAHPMATQHAFLQQQRGFAPMGAQFTAPGAQQGQQPGQGAPLPQNGTGTEHHPSSIQPSDSGQPAPTEQANLGSQAPAPPTIATGGPNTINAQGGQQLTGTMQSVTPQGGGGGDPSTMPFGFPDGRSGFMPGMPMAFNGMNPAFQQIMFRQGAEADALRQRMFGGGMPPGAPPGGFRPTFLAAPGGRINNISNDMRGLSSLQPTTPAVSLALACDDEHLSEYQILVRKQLEVFEALPEDVESNTQGRKKQVSLGQVGIRCKHCCQLPLRQRGRGAVYYPAKLQGVYQAAQNMASSHLCESCQCIDETLKAELRTLRERRDTASGGKQYWADGARALGLFEADDGLRLTRDQQQQQ